MAEKITQRTMFETTIDVVENANVDTETKDEIIAFLEGQIEKLDKRAEQAAKRKAQKKAEGDALRAVVYEVLTDEFVAIDDIVDAVIAETNDEDNSRNKIVARLSQLVEQGMAEKSQISSGSRKVMAYRAAGAEDLTD